MVVVHFCYPLIFTPPFFASLLPFASLRVVSSSFLYVFSFASFSSSFTKLLIFLSNPFRFVTFVIVFFFLFSLFSLFSHFRHTHTHIHTSTQQFIPHSPDIYYRHEIASASLRSLPFPTPFAPFWPYRALCVLDTFVFLAVFFPVFLLVLCCSASALCFNSLRIHFHFLPGQRSGWTIMLMYVCARISHFRGL